MNKVVLSILTVFVLCFSAVAQQDQVLLTVDGTPVYASEFSRVYKKNLELVQDERQKTVDGYLDLFIDYKLKVKEAQAQGLDKKQTYLREFEKYQEQLSRYYIYEDNVTSDLVREAYERGQEEIEARHLLILTSYSDSPADTLAAYNKIKKLREQALNGADFTTLVKENSEEPNASESGGQLGYFSVFSLVYPFETAAYNTPEGEISEIVRTRFGYHIIKVTGRRAREPKRTVSHIMISDRNDNTRTFDPEERINEIYQLLQQGQSFEELAKQYSEDKGSANQGGQLRPVAKGEITAEVFDQKIFSLTEEGEVTKPFKSSVGWHIARLDKINDNPSFEDEEDMLTRRVKDGTRSKIVTAAVKNQIMDKYGFKMGAPYLEYFKTFVTEDLKRGRWKYEPIPENENSVMFTIGDRPIYFEDFALYLSKNQMPRQSFSTVGEALVTIYDTFETETLKSYYKDKLEDEDPEYAAVISEYRDGLLIFDLMQKNVWNKAKMDTTAAKAFYEASKEKYKWNTRVDAIIVNASEKSYAEQARTLLMEGASVDAIKKALNTNEQVNVILSAGTFEEDSKALPQNLELNVGVSETLQQENRYSVVKVNEVIPPSIKSYDEVRGKVMTEYQQYLEEQLMDELREKYTVDVNKKTLKKLKKELEQ
ncbi:MAG: peptidylprolyl isomerase [Marinirhabdus sp.]|nr:peptidylprolyl isomerase [Marinirhabdus sp.]